MISYDPRQQAYTKVPPCCSLAQACSFRASFGSVLLITKHSLLPHIGSVEEEDLLSRFTSACWAFKTFAFAFAFAIISLASFARRLASSCFSLACRTRFSWISFSSRFRFRSAFVCPVSREAATRSNPPVLLPCGHVLGKLTVQKLLARSQHSKCPYCPTDFAEMACMELVI